MGHHPYLLFLALLPLASIAQNQDIRATFTVDGNKEKSQNRSHVSLESVAANECVVYECGGASLSMRSVRMNKTAGTSTDSNRESTGSNSAFLADGQSSAELLQCEANCHADKSFGIAAKDKGTKVSVIEGRTTVSKDQSIGIYAFDGALITVSDHVVQSHTRNSPALCTGIRGEIEASQLTGGTKGLASPLFSSRGKLVARECRMSAVSAPIAYIRDNGSIELKECELEQNGSCGFLIFDGSESSKSRLTIEKCKLDVNDGPLFAVDGNSVEIIQSGNSISLSDDCLMSVKGGDVTLSVSDDRLNGDIVLDSVASLSLTMGKGMTLTSAINRENNPDAHVEIRMDKGSTWHTTANSYIASISFEAGIEKGLKQIKGKFDIFYDAGSPENAYLGGKEYETGGKGLLRPAR